MALYPNDVESKKKILGHPDNRISICGIITTVILFMYGFNCGSDLAITAAMITPGLTLYIVGRRREFAKNKYLTQVKKTNKIFAS